MLQLLLPQFDNVIFTRYQINPRGVTVEELQQIAASLAKGTFHVPQKTRMSPFPKEAWQTARELSGPDDLIVITGSFFIAAELGTLARQLNNHVAGAP